MPRYASRRPEDSCLQEVGNGAGSGRLEHAMIDVLAWAGAVLSAVLCVPQATRALRGDRLVGVSAMTYWLTLANAVVWLAWAGLTSHHAVGVASLVNGPASVVILLRLRGGRRRGGALAASGSSAVAGKGGIGTPASGDVRPAVDRESSGGTWSEVQRAALLRHLAVAEARRHGVHPDPDVAVAALRASLGLATDDDLEAWCASTGLDEAGLRRLAADEARLAWARRRYGDDAWAALPDELLVSGWYPTAAPDPPPPAPVRPAGRPAAGEGRRP